MTEPSMYNEAFEKLSNRVSTLEKALKVMYDLHNCDSVSSDDGENKKVCPICEAHKEAEG